MGDSKPAYRGNHARSRRAGPLHRWLVDDAAPAEPPGAAVIAAGPRQALRASDDIHDGAPRRPDEQFTRADLGRVGVRLNRFVKCDAINGEFRMSFRDPARYVEPGRRVGVFLTVARVECAGSRV